MSDYEVEQFLGKVYFRLWALVPILFILGLFWKPAMMAFGVLFLSLCAIFVIMLLLHG